MHSLAFFEDQLRILLRETLQMVLHFLRFPLEQHPSISQYASNENGITVLKEFVETKHCELEEHLEPTRPCHNIPFVRPQRSPVFEEDEDVYV